MNARLINMSSTRIEKIETFLIALGLSFRQQADAVGHAVYTLR
jgi:hypothetical protein